MSNSITELIDEIVNDISEVDEKLVFYTPNAWMTDVNILYALKMSSNDCTTLPIYTKRKDASMFDDEFSFGIKINVNISNYYKVKTRRFDAMIDNKNAPHMLRIIREGIERCKKKEKIIALRMRLTFFRRSGTKGKFQRLNMEHSNLLIINYINNTIERFEPQIMDTPYGASEIDKIIQYDIVDKLNDLYNYNFKYVSSIEVCPINKSIQTLEESVNFDWTDVGGFCSAYSALYARLRISYPLLSQMEIIDTLLNKFNNNPEEIKTFMIKYVSYQKVLIEQSGLHTYKKYIKRGLYTGDSSTEYMIATLELLSYIRKYVWAEYANVLDMKVSKVNKLFKSAKKQKKILDKRLGVETKEMTIEKDIINPELKGDDLIFYNYVLETEEPDDLTIPELKRFIALEQLFHLEPVEIVLELLNEKVELELLQKTNQKAELNL